MRTEPSLGWRVIERGVISYYSNRLPSYLSTFTGKIFEESKNVPVEAIGFGIFVLVTDEFMHQAKQPPFFGLVRSSLIESQTEKTTFV
jgi:hypothetical protein